MTGAPLLEIRGMHKAFGGLTAVRNATFTVRSGEIVGLIGPNGSGKTTLINLISGALKPDNGVMLFGGAEVTAAPAHFLARGGIARTFQLVRVIGEMTALENVMSGMVARRAIVQSGRAASEARAQMARVGLEGKEAVPAADLTYGDQKRVELARALALRPRLLLLDEWLAGLNTSELHRGIELIASLAQEEAPTIIMVEHVMAAIRSLCPRCIVMDSGTLIADGPTADVMLDHQVITAYLGDADA